MKMSETTTADTLGTQATGDRSAELVDLIARLEKATRPDRVLDADIWESVGRAPVGQGFYRGSSEWDRHLWFAPNLSVPIESPPSYTSSIDAALTLVPEGWEWALHAEGGLYRVEMGDPMIGLEGEHETAPAIALCIAALKARLATSSAERSPVAHDPSNGQ
jgi:hypothetical protein